MGKSKDQIEFSATIPLIQSAILVAGDGGAQIKLQVTEQDIAAIKKLMDLRGEILRVTVELE